MFPDIPSAFQTALFHPTPIHPKCQPGPEVRLYDPNTGKLIRKGSQNSNQSSYIQAPAPPLTLPVHGEHSLFRYINICFSSFLLHLTWKDIIHIFVYFILSRSDLLEN